MTNHDNFFSQYFLSVLDPLLGSPARYQKISRPPFTRGSRGYAAAQPMFLSYNSLLVYCLSCFVDIFTCRFTMPRKRDQLNQTTAIMQAPRKRDVCLTMDMTMITMTTLSSQGRSGWRDTALTPSLARAHLVRYVIHCMSFPFMSFIGCHSTLTTFAWFFVFKEMSNNAVLTQCLFVLIVMVVCLKSEYNQA